MPAYRYTLIDVFTDKPFSGNQLAVFTDAQGLSGETMQSIAREMNLAETTFVFPAKDQASDFHVRIFSPAVEMPTAGHPTVGTALVLAFLIFMFGILADRIGGLRRVEEEVLYRLRREQAENDRWRREMDARISQIEHAVGGEHSIEPLLDRAKNQEPRA